ncbi:MAG: hypothetical protein ACKOCJ_08455 [Burkholderiaceae bacterium]
MATPLLGLDSEGMARQFATWGEKPFRARQVLKWIHRRGATDFSVMTDLARSLRERLSAEAVVAPPEVVGAGADDRLGRGARATIAGFVSPSRKSHHGDRTHPVHHQTRCRCQERHRPDLCPF